jgi:IS1 family transposase
MSLAVVPASKVAPPEAVPVVTSEPSDVLRLQRTIESLERENAWLKAQLARIVRDKCLVTTLRALLRLITRRVRQRPLMIQHRA